MMKIFGAFFPLRERANPEAIDRHYIESFLAHDDGFWLKNAVLPLETAAWLTFSGHADNGIVSSPSSDTCTHDSSGSLCHTIIFCETSQGILVEALQRVWFSLIC